MGKRGTPDPIRRVVAATICALGLAGLPLASAVPAPESRSALAADPSGWKDIRPAADLRGWTRLPIPPSGTLGRAQWHVDPGTGNLVCDGDGGHDWLRYDREVGDFVYHVEWRFTPVEGKAGYNSGVFARNSADGTIWHQAQVGSKSGGFIFGMTPVNGKPARFSLAREVKEQRVRPAGEWNTYEVTCRGKSMALWVNGGVTNEWTACEVPRGYVGLEGEGWKIEFRSVKLEEL